jgi:hypothetical protein
MEVATIKLVFALAQQDITDPLAVVVRLGILHSEMGPAT